MSYGHSLQIHGPGCGVFGRSRHRGKCGSRQYQCGCDRRQRRERFPIARPRSRGAPTLHCDSGPKQRNTAADQELPGCPRILTRTSICIPTLRGCRRASLSRRWRAPRRRSVLLRLTRSCRASSSLRDERPPDRRAIHRPGGFQSPLSLSITILSHKISDNKSTIYKDIIALTLNYCIAVST